MHRWHPTYTLQLACPPLDFLAAFGFLFFIV